MRFGMRSLVGWSLLGIFGLSSVLLGVILFAADQPPLWLLMAYLMLVFFCIGILFGNMNSLAMEPLGHVAGTGAAIVGSHSLIRVLLGTMIGRGYNGTVVPLIAGLGVLAAVSLFVVRWADAD